MTCPKCARENEPGAGFCAACGESLALATLEVVSGPSQGQLHFLQAATFTIGRAESNQLCLPERVASREHARIVYENGQFTVEDLKSNAGVTVDGARVRRAGLGRRSTIVVGESTLHFRILPARNPAATTDPRHQQVLLSVVEAINSTRVVAEVLEEILQAVMSITEAERGFVLLTEEQGDSGGGELLEGFGLKVARSRSGPLRSADGISTSVLRRVRETGELVATGNALEDPTLQPSQSVMNLGLRTIVCIPMGTARGAEPPALLGAIYVDNHALSAPFNRDSLRAAEALSKHAALAIENARLFESEQRTIQELKRARDEAVEANRVKTAFLANMSHELHTPLNAIIGYAEFLLETVQEREVAPDLIRIRDSGRHLLRLVDEVLDFSRLEEGKLDLHLGEVDPSSVAHEVVKGAGPLAQKNGNTLELVAPDVGMARADGRRLKQALRNVVLNAAKFTARGQIRVEVGRDGRWITFCVTDTGVGMDAEQAERVFEVFTQGDSSAARKHDGTGIGLAITKRLIEAMAGGVSVQSELGKGSVFTIRVPAAQPEGWS